MTYYFMPRVPDLDCEVTLVNRPPRDTPNCWRGAQTVHAAWSDGETWCVESVLQVETDGDIRVSTEMLPSDCPDDAMPVLFMSPQTLAGKFQRLPPLNHMETTPAWRANIRLMSATTSVSYLGEYPTGMTTAKASLISLAPLLQTGDGIANALVFVNIHADPAVEPYAMDLYAASSAQQIAEARVFSNRCTVIPLDPLPNDPDGLLLLTCRNLTGIPLYLSYTQEHLQMSLEHSHPPIELVAFGNRPAVNREMKRRWFARAGL